MNKPWLRHYEPQVPPALEYPKVPLSSFLEQTAARFPDHIAAHYFNAKMTYKNLNLMAGHFAASLASLGFSAGDRVALMMPNCPQMLAAYYGVLKARGVVVQINPLLAPPEVDFIIRDSGARIMVCLPRYEASFVPLLKEGILRHVVLTDVGDYASPIYRLLIKLESRLHHVPEGPKPGKGGLHKLSDLLATGASGAYTPPPAGAGDLAMIQYTGGTTGTPKGVMLTHANLVANTLQCRSLLYDVKSGPGGDIFLGVTPFFHVYGMTVVMNLAVYAGCTLVLLPRFIVNMVAEAVKKYKCTIFPGVELMYNTLNNSPKSAKGYLSSIRACISGAGPLYRAVQEKFESLTGGRVVEGYGLSEASPVTHCNPIFGERRIGTIGLPVPDTEAKIVDAAGGKKDMRPGEPGELIVRGPQVMQGYWNRPEDTKKALRGGWLYTGDLAVMDNDGYFRIMERKSDMIKSRGENVYPRNIEEALKKHPDVADAVVVGLPDEATGEKIKAYITVHKGSVVTVENLLEFCKRSLAKFEVPQEFEFRESLPKNLIGKILRRKLREEEKAKGAK